MKPLFALFVAGCTFMVVAAGAIWAWQTGSPLLLGSGRLDGAEPPGRFAVVVHEPGGDGYRYLRWEQLPDVEVDGTARTFLLPETGGGGEAALSKRQAFRVVENRGDRQIVEVNVLDTHQSWSRYEAHRDRIVPIAFRTDGGPLFIGMIGFVTLVAAAWVAKRTYWLVANRIGAHHAGAEWTAPDQGQLGTERMDLGPTIMQWLDELAECSEDPAELTRRYLTPEHAQATELVMRRMREAGMGTRLDAVGNVVGHCPGRRPGARRLILGSHLDTVRNAGKYDGALGVMLPIACLRWLHERGRPLDYPIDVIAFGDEEGVRFQATLIGSQAVAGDLDLAMLHAVDEDGIRLEEAMRGFGLDPDAVGEAGYRPDEVAAYVEVHIEQGPVLEAEDLPVGVVTSIAGAVRLRVEVMGRAGHAGTVPMNLRRDALAAASEAVLAVERICLETPGTVGTVGMLRTVSGAVNVIPGVVEFTIDVRGESDDRRRAALDRIDEAFAEIASRARGCCSTACRPTRPAPAGAVHGSCAAWARRSKPKGARCAGSRAVRATTPWPWPASRTSGCCSCAARRGSATIRRNP